MARLNERLRLMILKIVYWGPPLAGKTTNVVRLHARFAPEDRGELVRLDTIGERTLFFDYFPANLGTVAGYQLKAEFFAVPGQTYYTETRRTLLQGADGVVFVADSAPARAEDNHWSVQNLADCLADGGRSIEQFPIVFQWNKRDLPDAAPESVLQSTLNPRGAPAVSASAAADHGVVETQQVMLRSILGALRGRARRPRRDD